MARKPRIKQFSTVLLIGTFSALLSIVFWVCLGTLLLYHSNVEIRRVVEYLRENHSMTPFLTLMAIVWFSFLFSCLVSALLIRWQLKPFRALIDGMNRLSHGDFQARLPVPRLRTEEFVQVTESFNRMAEELSNTELLRKDFVNNFSHEFKTPITSIRGFARILQGDELTEEERKEYLSIIAAESDRLSRLAHNVLLLSKVEHQGIVSQQSPFHPAEDIRLTILALEPTWTKKALTFELELEELTFSGNQELLRHVWSNLIENAIKFSAQGQEIHVRLFTAGGRLCFEVTDFGIGMSQETCQRVFEKFYQGDSARTTPGNGIGLSIVKSVVLLHGGDIAVSSSPGQGAQFSLQLPLP